MCQPFMNLSALAPFLHVILISVWEGPVIFPLHNINSASLVIDPVPKLQLACK